MEVCWMPIQIGAKPDAGFDDPLGMLRDCHRRIENFLRMLGQVAGNRRANALSAEEQTAVESALAYFRTGGQRHTQDEEESLFPRLRGLVEPSALQALGDLEQEHSEATALHADVDLLFRGWIESGYLSDAARQRLLSETDRLQGLYKGHIQVEESMVFPRAAAVLSAENIAEMGSEFRTRRSAAP
jgi:hemerythrin-like domain-containing protein